MGLLESVYDCSPIPFQNLMCSISGWQKYTERYGRPYWFYREFFSDFDGWSLERQLEWQLAELRKFVAYAMDRSPFYADLYKGFDPYSIRGVDDLKGLPIVDKEMLRTNIDRVVTIPRRGAVVNHTGGTTGKSLVVLSTRDDSFQRMAMLDNFKSRVGFENLKMRRATFNGKHIVPPNQSKKEFWRYNAACKQMIYSSFHLTEENMSAYITSLNEYKPQALDGFFTSMCDLAGFIERHGIKVQFSPIAIFPTSETLTKDGRELLERVFRCKVYNQYASSEGAPFINECPDQKLHMELASGVFEHIAPNDTEVLVTSFTTHGTPLIRYRIGDKMVFENQSNEVCSCGLRSPLVREIQGRRLDFLYTPSGAKINAGNVANLLKNLPNTVIRAQFIQPTKNEVEVLLQMDGGYLSQSDERQLVDEFYHKFGSDMRVHIHVVDDIPRESSGKFRMIKNLVDDTP